MKKDGIFSRVKRGFVCLGTVVLEDLRRMWRKSPASRPRQREIHPPGTVGHFPPDDWRQKVLDDFALWLKELDSSTPVPAAPDLSLDLFGVLSELSAFRQEVKRQSREQGRLNEELTRMEGLYREALHRLTDKSENLVALKQSAQSEAERSVFLLFADVRDVLQRGVEEARQASHEHRSFWKRRTARREVQEGYDIALARFDRAMAHLGIEVVPTRGQPFDSRLMTAIATRDEPGIEAGTVLEESLSGYVRGEVVLRTAHVVVAADARDLEKG